MTLARRALPRWFGVGALACAATLSTTAGATPSRWAMARSQATFDAEMTRQAAEEELLAHRAQRRSSFEDPILRVDSHAPRAAEIIEKAGPKVLDDWYVRMLLARAYHEGERWLEASKVFESVLTDGRTPDVFRADALAELAIDYARLNRQDDEIEAYELALALEPHTSSRATMLANQAEAFMVKGDTSRAIAGYRASLEALTSYDAPVLAPTTYWSLGVALDRSGDLEDALDSISRARSYDPHDVRIGADTWFFVPAYDENYYEALGEWLVARRSPDTEVRLGAYERAEIAWKQYLGRAPDDDHYAPVARARLRLLEKEFAEFAKRARTPTPIDPRRPASNALKSLPTPKRRP
ncbi:MAG: tetratricopeptide repeat protein [Polyangiaceae bacterium]|nr:tetratricopeptide repeat protein [Polyangiaceae bacterium]